MRQTLRQMTRRVFLKAATLATAAAGVLAISADEGCGNDSTSGTQIIPGPDGTPGSDPCDPSGTGYGYGYGYGGYQYGYGYHYGYGRYGYGCYTMNLSPQHESDMVLDRAARYLASLSRNQWPVGKGSRIKIRIT